jgi:hypothetical protein
MRNVAVAVQGNRQVARSLKILVPLIQSELQDGNNAGHEHFTRAGRMLIEARGQVPKQGWARWLTKNFELSRSTAYVYMAWARAQDEPSSGPGQSPSSLSELTGATERRREQRQSRQQQAFNKVLRDVSADDFVQERQARNDEIQLHRDLAEEMIDIGYRALATKLHPDRGGSRDAMARLNRVRDELKSIAATRRFV